MPNDEEAKPKNDGAVDDALARDEQDEEFDEYAPNAPKPR